jgi:hypothetical protein
VPADAIAIFLGFTATWSSFTPLGSFAGGFGVSGVDLGDYGRSVDARPLPFLDLLTGKARSYIPADSNPIKWASRFSPAAHTSTKSAWLGNNRP